MDLKKLTDKKLMIELFKAVKVEKESTIFVLRFLREAERRRLLGDYDATSLFSFCTDVLKYSESEATIRVNALRLMMRSSSN